MRLKQPWRRSGAHAVECALVYPIVFFLVLALVVGGMGVYRYQQVCFLAREAARFASVHGGQYQLEQSANIKAGTVPDVDDQYLITNIIMANSTNMELANTQVTVSLNTPSGTYDWDDTTHNGNRWPYTTATVNNANANVTNTVSVTITYTWNPELYLIGPFTLTSTSVMPMCY